MTLRVAQESRFQGGGRWKWAVWLDGPGDELDNVEAVTWFLHPTFPDPVRTVSDRATGFRLESSGWGEFELALEIHRRRGGVLRRRHQLVLEYPAEPPGSVPARAHTKRAPARRGLTAPRDRPFRVFISHSALERPLVKELAEHLRADAVQVFDDADLDPGLPFRVAIERAMSAADAAVVIVSDHQSDFIAKEVETARRLGLPVFPVVVGGVPLPADLADTAALAVDSPADLPSVAGTIVDRLREIG